MTMVQIAANTFKENGLIAIIDRIWLHKLLDLPTPVHKHPDIKTLFPNV